MEILIFVILLLLGIGANEVFRRFPKVAFIFFVPLPVAFAFIWAKINPDVDWFFWSKLALILAITWILLAVRFTKFLNQKLGFILLYAFLVFNMLVAIIRQIMTGEMPDIFNAVAGMLILATLPRLSTFSIADNQYKDLHWDISYFYIFAYTLWDFVYIYSVFPASAARMLIGLLAPLLISLWNRKHYFQARVITLAFYFFLIFTVPASENLLSTPNWDNPFAQSLLCYISFGYMVLYTSYYYGYVKRRTGV